MLSWLILMCKSMELNANVPYFLPLEIARSIDNAKPGLLVCERNILGLLLSRYPTTCFLLPALTIGSLRILFFNIICVAFFYCHLHFSSNKWTRGQGVQVIYHENRCLSFLFFLCRSRSVTIPNGLSFLVTIILPTFLVVIKSAGVTCSF